MKISDYQRLIELLTSAVNLLEERAWELSPADLRIKYLVRICAAESERAMRETLAAARSTDALPVSDPAHSRSGSVPFTADAPSKRAE